MRNVEWPEVELLLESIADNYKSKKLLDPIIDLTLVKYDPKNPSKLEVEAVCDGYVVDPKVIWNLKNELIYKIFTSMSDVKK